MYDDRSTDANGRREGKEERRREREARRNVHEGAKKKTTQRIRYPDRETPIKPDVGQDRVWTDGEVRSPNPEDFGKTERERAIRRGSAIRKNATMWRARKGSCKDFFFPYKKGASVQR